MTAQATFTSEKVRRTKFFFGVRYMWSKQQLSEPFSNIGAGCLFYNVKCFFN